MKEKVRWWLVIFSIGGSSIVTGITLFLIPDGPSITEDMTPLFLVLFGGFMIVSWPVMKNIWWRDLPDDKDV